MLRLRRLQLRALTQASKVWSTRVTSRARVRMCGRRVAISSPSDLNFHDREVQGYGMEDFT